MERYAGNEIQRLGWIVEGIRELVVKLRVNWVIIGELTGNGFNGFNSNCFKSS